MSSKKLTDIDIVRVLNCCYDKDEIILSFYENDKLKVDLTVQDIIDILNRLKSENERLESLCEKIGIANDAKFERICVLQEDLETAKSEARKEFVTKAEEKASKLKECTGTEVVFTIDDLYELSKEMG